MIYIPIILSVIFGISTFYFFYKTIKLKEKSQYLDASLMKCQDELAVLEAEKIGYIQRIEQLSSKILYQEKFIEDFEKLREDSKQSTKAALFDLGSELSKQLIDIHKKENEESRVSSKKSINEASEKFNTEFERVINMLGSLNKEVSQSKDTVDVIKNSLLSPSGAGSLAEITLENILKSSGLRSNIDYMMQYSVLNEEKDMIRPDAVIFLPNDKLMVVDAKASKFLVDDKDDVKNLARTMNSHLKSLGSKNYAEIVQKDRKNKDNRIGNIVTLMFVPSEHAVEKIIEADKDFMNKAWKLNIFPVGPAGLMNMLSFAKFQISEQMMLHNHEQIIEEVKKLLSSVTTMADHSSRLGASISSAVNHYDKFAASFNRNFLSKARNISKLGIDGGLKKSTDSLQRLQIVASKGELVESEEDNNSVKEIEEVI